MRLLDLLKQMDMALENPSKGQLHAGDDQVLRWRNTVEKYAKQMKELHEQIKSKKVHDSEEEEEDFEESELLINETGRKTTTFNEYMRQRTRRIKEISSSMGKVTGMA